MGGGTNDTPFPSSEGQIEIGDFRYDAKRMGGAPTITANVMYPTCLDNVWTENVYAEFCGEKYYLKQTPTSSYSHDEARYKHEIELVSERIILDNVYFFDAVVGEPLVDDKPVSNSSKVVFFGDIHAFAQRMNASLRYSKLQKVASDGAISGYRVVVDTVEMDGVEMPLSSEEKLLSFEDQFFSNVLQEIYNTYNLPYYFSGKEIHIGYTNDVVPYTFSYGIDSALLSVKKTNANYKIVKKATGTGSSDNIPFYYPNTSPKGYLFAESSNSNLDVTILNHERYSNEISLDGVISRSNISYSNLKVRHLSSSVYSGKSFTAQLRYGATNESFEVTFDANDVGLLSVTFSSDVIKYVLKGATIPDASFDIRYSLTLYYNAKKLYEGKGLYSVDDILIPVTEAGKGYKLFIVVMYTPSGKYSGQAGQITYDCTYSFGSKTGWTYDGKAIDLADVGLKVVGTPSIGDTITQRLEKYVKTSQTLMPTVYRDSDGGERFYRAKNYPFEYYRGYELQEGEYTRRSSVDSKTYVFNDAFYGDNGYYEFTNPYIEGKPKEHIVTFEDIKPTIKETIVNGVRIDQFADIAFDEGDNNETYEDEEGNTKFVHSYFFVKLHKMDFNLFDHAIEGQSMRIAMTSGACGACEFEITIDEETKKNTVQVDSQGNLIYDENGRVLCGIEDFQQKIYDFQPRQQDTQNYEVWIALKKEEDTFGIIMPYAPSYETISGETIFIDGGYRPTTDDTFVILGINLPQSYILNAEDKLEKEIVKYISENNTEKFNFSISFSRIYFEENPNILQHINENARFTISYNGKEYVLYVSSFSYSMSEDSILPEIKVELDEELTISQNAIQKSINAVKTEIGEALSSLDVAALASPYFLRKDTDDEARGKINFKKGIKFGEGGKVEVLDNNSAKLTIEYLEVTKKATFTSLEIQEKAHVGGQLLLTPAAITCGEVEDKGNFYRCYFQTKGIDGDEIFNQFAIDDQAICQTYNAWGSRYYWRRVTGIGRAYIDLSKNDCDEDSDIPKEGDKIIQLGNRNDATRQNAIVLAAHGDGSPYIIQYKGIDSFSLSSDKVVTKLSSTENIFTGKVHMEIGSVIPEDVIGDLSSSFSDSLEFGKYNLLRNSGFTGDFVTESLDDKNLVGDSQLFSDPLSHWSATSAKVQATSESQSGYECNLSNGTLRQEMMYNMIAGESYIFSFRGRGVGLTFAVGGVVREVTLNAEQERYVEKFVATDNSKVFEITDAQCVICELQLERGNVVSVWERSMWDNQTTLAMYQSLTYLTESIKNGSTDILGGLILSNLLLLGNVGDTNNTAGISGVYNDDNDVAFWGGGSHSQAVDAVMKYVNNPTYQPTEAEIATLAKSVITHGGRAIFNDAIIRGTVYAKDGVFEGEIKANKGNFGDFWIFSSSEYNDAGIRGQKIYDDSELHDLTLFPDYFDMTAYDESDGGIIERIRIAPYAYSDRYDLSGLMDIEGRPNFAAINISRGQIRGIRHDVLSTTGKSISLNNGSPYIIIARRKTATETITVQLPAVPEVGTTFNVINAYRTSIVVDNMNEYMCFNTETGETLSTIGWASNPPYKIDIFFDGSLWYVCPIR